MWQVVADPDGAVAKSMPSGMLLGKQGKRDHDVPRVASL